MDAVLHFPGPPRPMTRLGNRERHLLLSIELLDDASRPIKSDAIVGEVQEALAKQQEREKQQHEKEHAEKKKQQPPPTPPHLQVRHYSVHMGICLMRTPFSDSARVRAIIPTLRFVSTRPVRMTVLRVFGSATRARRDLALRLEKEEWLIAQRGDTRPAKEIRTLLGQLAELQKS